VTTFRVSGGYITVPIVCDRKASEGCEGALSLRYSGYRLGGGEFVTEPGKRDPVLVALTKKGRSLMRSHRRLKVKLYVAAKDAAGKKGRLTRTVQLVRAKK
jgi:hypothetical protein